MSFSVVKKRHKNISPTGVFVGQHGEWSTGDGEMIIPKQIIHHQNVSGMLIVGFLFLLGSGKGCGL